MPAALQLDQLKNVTILGAGTMGWKIALRSAIDGFNVSLYDISEKQLDKVPAFMSRQYHSLQKKAKVGDEPFESVMARIKPTMDPQEAADGADFVNESVLEDLDTKKKVYEQFAPLWPEHTLLTTNTSYLLPSMFAAETGRPEQFCAFHFHDVFTAIVVDVMPHQGTAPWIIPFLMNMGKKLNQIPVHVEHEVPGYLFNNMLMAWLGSAGALLTKGIATPEMIDKSWMGNIQTGIGPFGMLDHVGLDTAWYIVSARKDEKSKRFATLLKEYVEAGKLGVKTGEGFYQYPKPTYAEAAFLHDQQ